MQSTFGNRAIKFFSSLQLTIPSELGITVLNPYKEKATAEVLRRFYRKYFNDNRKRVFLLGINPGRFGGGITGVSFTDPVALRNFCGIENSLGTKRELSSEFIYMVIQKYGGVERFYRDFFMSAICPLGFTKGTVNYNYYDTKPLLEAVTPFIKKTFQQQIQIGARADTLICLGSDKNRKFMTAINNETGYFKDIISLEHPRFIMQYKRKKLNEYLELYVRTLYDSAQK